MKQIKIAGIVLLMIAVFYLEYYVQTLLMGGDPFVDKPWWNIPTSMILVFLFMGALAWSVWGIIQIIDSKTNQQ